MAGFSNNFAGTELIFRHRMLYDSPYDKMFSYFTGNRLRNLYYHTGAWGNPALNAIEPSGIARILGKVADNTFVVEDWVHVAAGLYNDNTFQVTANGVTFERTQPIGIKVGFLNLGKQV